VEKITSTRTVNFTVKLRPLLMEHKSLRQKRN